MSEQSWLSPTLVIYLIDTVGAGGTNIRKQPHALFETGFLCIIVDLTGLELKSDPSASASRVLGHAWLPLLWPSLFKFYVCFGSGMYVLHMHAARTKARRGHHK